MKAQQKSVKWKRNQLWIIVAFALFFIPILPSLSALVISGSDSSSNIYTSDSAHGSIAERTVTSASGHSGIGFSWGAPLADATGSSGGNTYVVTIGPDFSEEAAPAAQKETPPKEESSSNIPGSSSSGGGTGTTSVDGVTPVEDMIQPVEITTLVEEAAESVEETTLGRIPSSEDGLKIERIYANKELVYEDGEQLDTINIRDKDILTLTVLLLNPEDNPVNDIIIDIISIPQELNVMSIKPEIITSLAPHTTKEIKIVLESENIKKPFVLEIQAKSEQTSATVVLSIILEDGKGALYYTRQKIIQQIKEIVTKTYKILFLLFLIPVLLLLRVTTIVDERALRIMVNNKRIADYWRFYTSQTSYIKYNMFQNLRPIVLEDAEIQKANTVAKEYKVSYDIASLIIFANRRLIPRLFTLEEIPQDLRHRYSHILFTSPFRNYRENQLQRYIETEQKKGVSLGEIRKQLLDAKWDKKVIDKYVTKEDVLKEYITIQKCKGTSNQAIRKALLLVGWEKELVYIYLNPENDLKAYIISQQQKGE